LDAYVEKLIRKNKNKKDILFISGAVAAGLAAIFLVSSIPTLRGVWFFLAAGIGYGVYYAVISRNLEYEYILTNEELDIDVIIAERRRKRIFSSDCRDFEFLTRLKNGRFEKEIGEARKRIEAVSSMNSGDIYAAVLNYKGTRTAVFFEPDERMMAIFRRYIPKKIAD